MMLFHKLFSNEIKTSHRWSFWKCLGLSQENILFSEDLPGQTLRVLCFENGRVRALLNSSAYVHFPSIRLVHSVPLPEQTTKNKALTTYLLPFPWSFILSGLEDANTRLEFSDAGLRAQVGILIESFQKLEALLTQTEIACLQIGSNEPADAFIFHSVRGKIIRASFLPGFISGEYGRDLSQTTYSLTTLPTHNPLNLQGFQYSLWQVKTAVEGSRSFRKVVSMTQTLMDDPLEL